MKEQQKIFSELNELFDDLILIGFSRNIVETTIKEIKENKSKLDEEACKIQLKNWKKETREIEKKFYEFCRKNHKEYYQNKSGTEVFSIYNYYFSFHFGENMMFSTDLKSLSSEITSKLSKIDR